MREREQRAGAGKAALDARSVGSPIQVDTGEWEPTRGKAAREIALGEACLLWGRKALCVERRPTQRRVREGFERFSVREDEVIRLAVELADGSVGEHTIWASDMGEDVE